MYEAAVQLPNIILIVWIKPGLEEEPIFIAENLPCQTGSMVEICFDVIIHGEKDHADTIAHIGLAPGTVAAAIQTMAGLPGIFLAGHLQKIAGMDP